MSNPIPSFIWEALSLHLPKCTSVITASPHTLRMLGHSYGCTFDRECSSVLIARGIHGYAMGVTFMEDEDLGFLQFRYQLSEDFKDSVGTLDCSGPACLDAGCCRFVPIDLPRGDGPAPGWVCKRIHRDLTCSYSLLDDTAERVVRPGTLTEDCFGSVVVELAGNTPGVTRIPVLHPKDLSPSPTHGYWVQFLTRFFRGNTTAVIQAKTRAWDRSTPLTSSATI